MNRNHFFGAIILLLPTASTGLTPDGPPKSVNWPSFRGTNACGIAEGFETATTWNAEKSENIRWKVPIPGLGHSSPVVWGNHLFVLTAIRSTGKAPLKVGLYGDGDSADDDVSQKWMVYCVDKKTGKIIWQKLAHEGIPKIRRHTKATHANTTAATDGKRLVAFFGSEGLYCYDMSGKPLWKKDFGVLESGPYDSPELRWGFASSPILHHDVVYVECDVLKDSFLAALDAKDGHEIWRTPRDDVATWSTPAIVTLGGRTQLVVNGWKHMGGYEAKTGKELWRLGGGGDMPVPTPITGHGLIFIQNAHGKMAPIYAIRPTANGDITPKGDEFASEHIAWGVRRGGGYLQTPLIYGDYFYNCLNNGTVSCYEAKTGKRIYQERIGTCRTGFSASPVAANGMIYFSSEEGDIYVLKAGPELKLLATNPLSEICMATPAISEGVMYFRTQDHLVAVGKN